jgi:hypothetical protein
MRKKLLLLDLLLVALVVVLGARVRETWLEARHRESVVLGQPLVPLPPPHYSPLAPVEPLRAVSYAEVAQQMLFSADRNPTVIVEVKAPPKMPHLPLFYGLFILGGAPTAIMAENSAAKHQEIGIGQKIGEFTLLSIDRERIVLEWGDEKVTKRLEDLVAAAAPDSNAPTERTASTSAPQVSNTQTIAPSVPAAPGFDLGSGHHACARGDTSPSGTVVGGLRKVVRDGPFGEICEWVPAN